MLENFTVFKALRKEAAEKVQETEKLLGETKARLAFTKVKGVEEAFDNLSRNLEIKEQELAGMKSRVTTFDSDLDNLQAERQKLEEEREEARCFSTS